MKVSVLIYALNSLSFIETCVRSVMNQTLREIEILVIDGGSTDGTVEAVKKLAQTDARIRIIHSSAGVGRQFNTGLREAKGEYIGICESDDYLLPNMYEKQYEIAESCQLDMLRADAIHFIETDRGEFSSLSRLSRQETLYYRILEPAHNAEILKSGMGNFWSGLYRRKFLLEQKVFMNETKGAAYQDTSFLFLASIKAKRVMFSHEAFYCYRLDNPGSSVNRPQRITMLIDEYALLKKRLLEEGLFEAYKEIYLSWKVNGYLGFYDSLSEELKESFRGLMYRDIRSELESGGFSGGELTEKGNAVADAVRESSTALHTCLHQLYDGFYASKKALDRLERQRNVMIFGAGDMGKLVYRYLTHRGQSIKAYIDNNQKLWGRKVGQLPVMEPARAVGEYPDSVYVIANVDNFQAIKRQLSAMGVSEGNMIVCNDYGFFFKHVLLKSLKEETSDDKLR